MEMVEKFRQIAETFGWVFIYGRKDFQNLVEADDDNDEKWYFFLDPVTTDNSKKEEPTHDGYFMILSKSELDEEYDGENEDEINEGKWRKNIQPKRLFFDEKFRGEIECAGDFEFIKSRITDVINFFDDNMDGILCNYIIKQYK